jgi:GNAT superfamily N-acetyltransferase
MFFMESFCFVTKIGADIASAFDDLAQLRISVFRDYPYLYEGQIDYEKEYLQTYAKSQRAMLFAVYYQEQMIGATTCIPLADEMPEIILPFLQQAIDIQKIFYFGESLLLPQFRGLGLGHRFFDEREAHAQSFGSYQSTYFCSVDRGNNHPLKPNNYRPNDAFWLKRGYQQVPTLISQLSWPDIGQSESTTKPMIYWKKEL